MTKILSFISVFAAGYCSAQLTCTDALEISSGLHTVDTIVGTAPFLTCSGMAQMQNFGMWYRYSASEDYTITVTSNLSQNEAEPIDTRVHIYQGSCDSYQCLAGNDDVNSGESEYLSEVSFILLAGESVIICWDDVWSSYGFDFELVESEYVAPPIPPFSFNIQSIEVSGSRLGLVDMDGDYLDDIVIVQGGQLTIGHQLEDGGIDIELFPNTDATFHPSWSLAAGDFDNNGFNDLVYGSGSGVSFMYANDDGSDYSEYSTPEFVFSQRSNCIDINNDGYLDAFVCHDIEPNVYYINDGDGGLEFFQGGLGDSPNGGNYGSIWVDYDMDGDTDLFIAKCRGGNNQIKYNQLHRNNGDGTYTEVSAELGLDDPIQTWSSAWGDYDNDGDMDIFIGANSFFDGSHKLLKNNGNGDFEDITEGSGLNIGSTGIENVTHDFDNDGYLDILGAGSTFFKNNGDMTFSVIDHVNLPVNGAVGDINNDGFLDVVNTNIYINNGNENNWVKYTLIGTESNLNGIGAMVHLYSPNMHQIRELRSGDGFRYMSSLNLHFGLGEQNAIDSVVVNWPSGIKTTLHAPAINTTSTITEIEGLIVGLDDLDVLDKFKLYPNPFSDVLTFEFDDEFKRGRYAIIDMYGKQLLRGNLKSSILGLSSLKIGAYVLQLEVDGQHIHRKIIKE